MALLLALALAPRLLAVDSMVMGELRGGAWRASDDKTFLRRRLGRLVWHPVGLGSASGRTISARVASETAGYVGSFLTPHRDGVLLSGARAGRPRRVESLAKTNPVYRAVLRHWLDAKGMRRSPVRITGLFRADLDGDGTKEVLIEARSVEDMAVIGFERDPNPVDYSLVLLRGVRNGKAFETAIDFAKADGPQGSAGLARLRAIGDLDGDGRMDLVIGWDAWEVHAAKLLGYRAGELRTKLENGAAL